MAVIIISSHGRQNGVFWLPVNCTLCFYCEEGTALNNYDANLFFNILLSDPYAPFVSNPIAPPNPFSIPNPLVKARIIVRGGAYVRDYELSCGYFATANFYYNNSGIFGLNIYGEFQLVNDLKGFRSIKLSQIVAASARFYPNEMIYFHCLFCRL